MQSGHTLLRCRVGAAQRFHRTQDALTGNRNRTHSLTGMSRNAPSGTEGQSLDVSRSLMALVMGSWNVGGTFFSSLITLLSYRKMILRSFSSDCRCSRLGPNCRQSTMLIHSKDDSGNISHTCLSRTLYGGPIRRI